MIMDGIMMMEISHIQEQDRFRYNSIEFRYVILDEINNIICIQPVRIYSGDVSSEKYVYEICVSDDLVSSYNCNIRCIVEEAVNNYFGNTVTESIETEPVSAEIFSMDDVLDDIVHHPAFIEKIRYDEEKAETRHGRNKVSRKKRFCSWIEKNNFKKKEFRKFASINPDIDISRVEGDTPCRAIYFHSYKDDESGNFIDPRMLYWLNPYTRRYVTKRGNIKRYNGRLEYYRGALETNSNKRSQLSSKTNRIIRRDKITDESVSQYSFFKKQVADYLD